MYTVYYMEVPPSSYVDSYKCLVTIYTDLLSSTTTAKKQ